MVFLSCAKLKNRKRYVWRKEINLTGIVEGRDEVGEKEDFVGVACLFCGFVLFSLVSLTRKIYS